VGKIKSVKFKLNRFEYVKPFHITNNISYDTQNIEVIIELENGIIGRGEASPSFRVNGEKIQALLGLEPVVNEMIIGMDVRNYRQIFDVTDKLLVHQVSKLQCSMQFLMHLVKKLAFRFIKYSVV